MRKNTRARGALSGTFTPRRFIPTCGVCVPCSENRVMFRLFGTVGLFNKLQTQKIKYVALSAEWGVGRARLSYALCALCARGYIAGGGARIIFIIISHVPLATATGFAHFHARPVRGGGPPSTIRQPSPSSTCRAGGSSGPSTTYLRTRARVDAMRFDPRYQV